MDGERVVIAAANQGKGVMKGQEIDENESIMEEELEGTVELGYDTEASTINQSNVFFFEQRTAYEISA